MVQCKAMVFGKISMEINTLGSGKVTKLMGMGFI